MANNSPVLIELNRGGPADITLICMPDPQNPGKRAGRHVIRQGRWSLDCREHDADLAGFQAKYGESICRVRVAKPGKAAPEDFLPVPLTPTSFPAARRLPAYLEPLDPAPPQQQLQSRRTVQMIEPGTIGEDDTDDINKEAKD